MKKQQKIWQQQTFDEFYRGLPLHRRAADEEKLAAIFSHAAAIPTFRDALNWAMANKVKFFIDRKTTARGYYTRGAGVVALAHDQAGDIAAAAGVLTHEIRHAWQDKRHMIPSSARSFAEYFIKISLCEADATAFEKTAEAEARASWPDKPVYLSAKDKTQKMWGHFQDWYHGPENRAAKYGDVKAAVYGFKYSLPGGRIDKFNCEYKSAPLVIDRGIDVDTVPGALRLGKGFDKNENYLYAHADRDLFAKEYLSPGHAMTYFNGLAAKPDKLAARVRREMLRINAKRRIKIYS